MIVKKEIFTLFINKPDIRNKFVYKIISGNGINIIIIENKDENTLLLGNVINKENVFELQYIFNYEHKHYLQNALKDIYANYLGYIRDYLIIKEENDIENEFISQIFDHHGNMVGYGYKYSDNLLTKDITEYYLCDNFKSVILLFYYYNFLKYKVEMSYNNRENLYSNDFILVKKKDITTFKETSQYEYIISEIKNYEENDNKNDFNPTDKQIYSILKNLYTETYLKYNRGLKENQFGNVEAALVKNISYQDTQNVIHEIEFPYEFEIMPKKLIHQLNIHNNINYYEDNFTKIEIINSYIIIHFPKEYKRNQKYVSLVGTLDNNLSFEIKSIIISPSELEEIIDEIKNNFENTYNQSIYKFFKENNDGGIDECCFIKYNPDADFIINESINDDLIDPIVPNDNILEYNLDFQPAFPFIFKNFTFPPLKGLDNIGATCYMNATLQCFCNIQPFVDYFKYDVNLINLVRDDLIHNNNKKLISSFKLLIEKLWPNDYMGNQQKSYSPHEFKNKISDMNDLFKGVAANDSKDLVNFIIMTLHEELNAVQVNIIDNNPILDQRNMELMYNSFLQNFNMNNQSIISKLFYAMNCNVTKCLNCNAESYNFQTYFFLIFPLEEIRKFKLNNFNMNPINIYDCFDYERRINYMNGANAMYCNYCKQTCNSSMCSVLSNGPQILIVILNRGKGIEFKIKLNFFEDLNLMKYMQMPQTGCYYKLIGVISHLGESGMGGHFIAFCKNPIHGTWNKYNDSIVSPVTDFKTEVINFGMPYLLFYQKQG